MKRANSRLRHWFTKMWRPPLVRLGDGRGSRSLLAEFTDQRLRRDDAVGQYKNDLPKDLQFCGRVIVQVEDVWNDARTRGTPLDGEIMNRLAIYERSEGGYVAEQLRYNPRVIFVGRSFSQSEPLPLMSRAREFDTFTEAMAWISAGPLVAEGNLASLFAEAIAHSGHR